MASAAAERPAALLLLSLLLAAGGAAAQQQQQLPMNPLSEGLIRGLAQSLAAATPSAQAASFAADASSATGATGAAVGDTAGGLGPVLCDTLDCPNFKVLDRYEGGVELRRYDPASFVSTVLSLDEEGCIEKAAMAGFQRLIKYNFGDNEDEKKIPMTAPVLYALDVDRKASSRRALRWRDRFSVSFFVPFRYQDSPPPPSNPDVLLVDVKEVDVFVRAFDGFATASRIGRVASAFIRDLHDAGHKIDCRTVYVAQYSPPFQPVFRYNEVWILRRRRGRGTSGGPEPVDPTADVDPDQPQAPYDDDDDVDPARDDGIAGCECGAWLDGDDDDAAGGGGGGGDEDRGEWLQAVAA